MWDHELAEIAEGKYAARLGFLKRYPQARPVEEFYLLLDVENVEHTARDHFARRAYVLETWRNILISVPVLLTLLFFCLGTIDRDQTQPWSIVVIITDALLLCLLFLLTFLAELGKKRARERAARLRLWLDEEIYRLAASSLVKALGPNPGDQQPAWAVEVHRAITHLLQALTGVDKLVGASHITLQNIAQTAQEQFEASVREFRGLVNDQREAVEHFLRGTTEVRRAVDKLERIYTEGEHIYQGLNATLPRIDQSFRMLATRQDAAASALEAMNSQTSMATKAVGDIASQFTHADLVQSTYQAALSMQKTAEIMRNIAAQMGDTVHQQLQLQARLEQQINYTVSAQS